MGGTVIRKDPKVENEGEWFVVGSSYYSLVQAPSLALAPLAVVLTAFYFGDEALSVALPLVFIWVLLDWLRYEWRRSKTGPYRVWLGPQGLRARHAGRKMFFSAAAPLEYAPAPTTALPYAVRIKQGDQEVVLFASDIGPSTAFLRKLTKVWPDLEPTLISVYGREALFPNYKPVTDDDHLADWKVKW